MRLLAALLVAALAAPVLADDGPTIGGPTIGEPEPPRKLPTAAPATATAPAGVPATGPAAGSAESIRARLFNDRNTTTVMPVPMPPVDNSGPGTVEPVGAGEPKVKSVLEGTIVTKRVVRLTKDEKTGGYMVSFDADGNQMRDPPMLVLPSKTLAAMEELSQGGTRAVRFQITGEVTEYKGKNYILIHAALALRELGTGITGG
jgi:hypothetical protein